MTDDQRPIPVGQAGANSEELGERLAIRMMLAGIISYQAATSATDHMSALAIVAEMKRIMATVIEAMDIQVRSESDTDAVVVEEEIRRVALTYLEQTFAFVKV